VNQQQGAGSDEANDFFTPNSSAARLASSLLSPFLFSGSGARPGLEIVLPNQGGNMEGGGSESRDQQATATTTATRPPRRPHRGRYGVQTLTNFDNILQDILLSVANDGGNGTAGGGTPLFFMGNPGDYAWGREGLDTIVTQLLNQMDNTG
jgi:E3 ubiquitin-protein ligase RNF115/126